MEHPGKLSISDFTYELPTEKIALLPLEERDASRLLIYNNKKISEDIYRHIDQHIPEKSILVFNNTKVINARLLFSKSTGGLIEIFLLEPVYDEYARIMAKTEKVTWKCLVGGAAKWKQGPIHSSFFHKGRSIILTASLIKRTPDAFIVEFSWNEAISFAEVLECAGIIPLPPYIKRETEEDDKIRYQTIYARYEGSVAAPTAGLHFTDAIFTKLSGKGIRTQFVTLHVGAGTFMPVKSETMLEHEMHAEWIDVSMDTIRMLAGQDFIVAVGTTSTRTIESLYWMGLKASADQSLHDLSLKQWEPYEERFNRKSLSHTDALNALIDWMKDKKTETLIATTQLLIAPGYQFKIVKALVTNFHQPGSTLLLLVAAAIGKEWKAMYDHALKHDYRFLSYGDGNLIFIDQG